MKFLIVGNGGRESAFAKELSVDSTLYAVMSHKNHGIIEYIESTGGKYLIGDPSDPKTVTDFAIENSIDYAFINSDEPLANGVVDSLLKAGLKAVGGTREATRIEWDKIYSIELMKRVCPTFTPFFLVVKDASDIKSAISEFESRGMEIVVKPQGLTGGKGVKVMPEHLQTYNDCIAYATKLLEKDQGVLFVEKLNGIEFTIMGITDGKTLVLSPASYDYPFRNEDDTGPGTGGMGCFTNVEKKLPFLTDNDMNDCKKIMQSVIDDMRYRGMEFKGVLNGGFFKTSNGIKFMEFNGRFGDPEVLCVLSVLDGSFSKIITSLWDGTLSKNDVQFQKKASVVKYMVASEYPDASMESIVFEIDESNISKLGVEVFLASCIKIGNCKYETLKRSRVVAFVAVSNSIQRASSMIDQAIEDHVRGNLEYRRDIGSKHNLEKLDKITAEL